MAFSCPGCDAQLDLRPHGWALRCPSCRAVIRSRAVDDGGPRPAYDLEVVGRPETRRRVEIAWDEAQARSLHAWLFWSSAVTLGLVAVLYALTRFWR